jgi:tRNA G46 methylase TrmB
VSLELRHARVYQTFTRAIFEGANNLCVMGGDASQVLWSHVAPGQVSHLFINHPEPPQQSNLVRVSSLATSSCLLVPTP